MKISNIYIAAFGGLKDFSLDFTDGFNVIYAENENGKSTVMAFIKMMFYGNERGSAIISKNPRKKYQPWNGEKMSGRIEFEHSGKKYRLEREFRGSNATDKSTLTDLDFGTRQAVSGDIGNKFFGLSAAAFERSVFIGQLGAVDKDASADGEINSKLSNIALTGDEDISYETVRSRILKAKLQLNSKSGHAGIYDKNLAYLSELTEQLKTADDTERKLNVIQEKISLLKTEIAVLEKQYALQKKVVDSEQDIRNAQKLEKLLELKAELDKTNDELKLSDGKVIDEMFVRKLIFCISKLDNAAQKINSEMQEIAMLEKSLELALHPTEDITPENQAKISKQLSILQSQKQEKQKKSNQLEEKLREAEKIQTLASVEKKKINLPFLIGGVVLLVFSAVFASVLKMFIISGVFGLTGVVAILLSFILRQKDKNKIAAAENNLLDIKSEYSTIKSELSETETAISTFSARLQAITAALNSSSAVIEHQKAALSEKKDSLKATKYSYNEIKISLFSTYSSYKPIESVELIKSELESLSAKAEQQKKIKLNINFILNEIGNISYEEAALRLQKINSGVENRNIDFDTEKDKLDNLNQALSSKKSELSGMLAEIKTGFRNAKNPAIILSEIRTLKEKVLSQKEFCDASDIALNVLEASFAEIRRSYGSMLDKHAADIFSGLTDGKYVNMNISKEFEITVEQPQSVISHEIDYLSSGAADQAYLSLRLALSSLISKSGEALPVLLDDALTQYDDKRAEAAIKFLKNYSIQNQIIMFTCHKALLNCAKEYGADTAIAFSER